MQSGRRGPADTAFCNIKIRKHEPQKHGLGSIQATTWLQHSQSSCLYNSILLYVVWEPGKSVLSRWWQGFTCDVSLDFSQTESNAHIVPVLPFMEAGDHTGLCTDHTADLCGHTKDKIGTKGQIEARLEADGGPVGVKDCAERGERGRFSLRPPHWTLAVSQDHWNWEGRKNVEFEKLCLKCKLCECVSFRYLLMMMSRRARTTRVIMIFICGRDNTKETAVDACEKHKGVTH